MTTTHALVTQPTATASPSRLSIWMPGKAPNQGSLRPVHAGGRLRAVHQLGDPLMRWRATLTGLLAALPEDQHAHLPLHGPLMLGCSVAIARPRDHYRRGALKQTAPLRPITRPDIDKVVRAICDALTIAGAWDDDRQCVNLWAMKTYAPTPPEVGVEILVRQALDRTMHPAQP